MIGDEKLPFISRLSAADRLGRRERVSRIAEAVFIILAMFLFGTNSIVMYGLALF